MTVSDLREERIRAFFPVVKKIARRVQGLVPSADVDDLVGDGCIGLIRAADTFDASRGPSFERYASRIVAGAMLNGLRRLDPVSERVRREIRQADRERFAIASQSGTLPSQLEMEARRPALRRANVQAYRHAPLSLDAALPAGESLGSDWSGDPAAVAEQRATRAGLKAALHRLPLRHQFVVTLHYFRGQSLHQIGRVLAISPQRASQLHVAALAKLRRAIDVPR